MELTSRPSLIANSFIWLAVTIFGAFLLFNIKQYVNFGIDLVGGTYLTLDVKIEEAVKNELFSEMASLTAQLKEESMDLPAMPKFDRASQVGTLEFKSEAEAEKAYKIFEKTQENLKATRNQESHVQVTRDKNKLKFSLLTSYFNRFKEGIIEDNISILRNRLDVFGAGEITIVPQGDRSIVIELPNVSDSEKAKARIGQSALLELKPVYDHARTKETLLENSGGEIPEGTMIVEGSSGEEGFYLVPNYAKITGSFLKKVSYLNSPPDLLGGEKRTAHLVAFQLNHEGAVKFKDLTEEHVGDQIAIIIDNKVISAPTVNQVIEGGEATISGNFTQESANELVTMLKSGSFSAPVDFVEERHIGPSLGQEAIHKGLMSCSIGLGLLLAFSLLVYKTAGIFAFIVLLYNLLLILFGLAIIPDATLTLPGIAGMVLTVGMAIDASILIYERIKEELFQGVNLKSAVNSGFQGATGVILDSNITTFLVGAVLYYFGTPAIQGFALTMMLGILSTLITGLVLLKWLFNFSFDILHIKKISF